MKAERHFVDFVGHSERKGVAASQFPLWFSVNMMLLTSSAGAVGVLAGLNLVWSLIAIICGNCLGAIFVALHCVQGPRLGVPQMIQSRAQFGVYGAVIPLIFVLIMYVGYYASNTIIGADAASVGLYVPGWLGVVVITGIIFIINFFGHDLIHGMAKIFAILLAVGFLVLSIVVALQAFPESAWNLSSFNLYAFVLMIAVTATWQLTFAPYVADYSRYLPENTSAVKTFFFTYAGLVTATVWLMTLGAAIAVLYPHFGNHPTDAVASFFPSSFVVPIAIFIILGIVATNVMNMYGAAMSVTTILDTFIPVKSTPLIRAIVFGVVSIIAGTVSIAASADFMAYFMGLIGLLGYLLFPWTIINLTDFFLVRKEKYVIEDLFDKNGIYGKFGSPALIAYAIAIVCEIPFMTFFSFNGFMYTYLGGLDLAWVVALAIPGFIYYYLSRNQISTAKRMA